VVLLPGCVGSPPAEAPGLPPAATAEAPPAADGRAIIPRAAPEPPSSPAELRRARAGATGDLDAIAARGVLRILVTTGQTQYAVVDGMQSGGTFDAGTAFEAFLNAKRPGLPPLDVVFLPTPDDRLVSDLTSGAGDIAANLLITFERDDVVAFSTATRSRIREVIVTGPGVAPLVSLEDVAGRSIHVRKSSSHHASLVRLNAQLKSIDRPGCRIVLADETLTDEDLLRLVDQGAIDATVVDDYVLAAERGNLDRVAANADVSVSQDGAAAWATRKESTQLLAAINEFFATRRPGP
jgi:membrane-bound lytic murein transglycosylase MltF